MNSEVKNVFEPWEFIVVICFYVVVFLYWPSAESSGNITERFKHGWTSPESASHPLMQPGCE